MKIEFFPGCESIKVDILDPIKSSFPVPLTQDWRPILRARAQTANKFRRNCFACPYEFWRAK